MYCTDVLTNKSQNGGGFDYSTIGTTDIHIKDLEFAEISATPCKASQNVNDLVNTRVAEQTPGGSTN